MNDQTIMRHGRQGQWQICTKCSGEGHHCAHLGSYTASEFAEAFDDPEDRADYFAGRYDRTCERCRGSGKVWLDLGPHLTDEELTDEHPVCPCGQCSAEREASRYQEARERWAEDGCREDFYYEG